MPHIQITLVRGRTVEQKRAIARRVTDALAEEAGAARENISVAFVDVSHEDFARGGILVADRDRPTGATSG